METLLLCGDFGLSIGVGISAAYGSLSFRLMDGRDSTRGVATGSSCNRVSCDGAETQRKISNSNSRAFGFIFFEAEWRRKLFQMKVFALGSILTNVRPEQTYPRDFSVV